MSSIKFADLEKLYREMNFQPDGRSGTLTLSNQAMVDSLLNAISGDNPDDSGISLKGHPPSEVVLGKTVTLHIEKPRTGLGILALNFDHYLKVVKSCFEERKNYFLIDEHFSSKDTNTPECIERYRKLLNFIQHLKKSAAYFDKDKGELIFLESGKFSLPIIYTSEQLLSANVDLLDKIDRTLTADTHIEQKLAILGKSVFNLLKTESSETRFKYLLSHLDELNNSYSDGYSIFVSDFSYDKIRDQLEAAKVEYTGKIHKAISDIQNQILGIPVATIIVATQMKKSNDFGYEFWVNIAVLLGCWIFSALVGLMVWNQKHTLEVIGEEIDRQDLLMKRKYKDISEKFKSIFKTLKSRIRWQKNILWVVLFVLGLGFTLAHIAFFMLTPKAFDLVKALF
ncbi:hypothetical protein ACS78V_17745 [Yersinia enterocolitica]|uniref:Phage-related membrane protein n=1 Tax=Yersinia pekkanenii TaxID=1288385 RepID=A0A0T9RMC9_9GAMM|nr:hypothetical protein [Yersinia pekkanenii]EKN4744972.1 hypothetical protein [Yersinia enterocolitica]EKN4810893.1 hypothetical protein [Yersinia enterocolitica]CNI71564.1 Uncharacterised protein [Yersinia pekkanenii]CRY69650.1 Uncharacterised protein [Yersinia pekkanenii]HDL8154118.1 hypothetical protein [Yersinia enterocolitica]